MQISREILLGITYSQIVNQCAGMSYAQAAKTCGVGAKNFTTAIRRNGMAHWFQAGRRNRRRCVTEEQVREVVHSGLIRADAAEALGISVGYLRNLMRLYNIQMLHTSGKGSWLSRRGYVG
jgi:hypothetical protein